MELSINTEVLSKLLQRVSGIKGKMVPILSHVLLEARKEGTFVVSASDLEVGMRVTTNEGIEIAVPGGIAVRADQFREIVKHIPGEEVRLEVLDGLRLEITSGDFVSRIAGRDREEFPQIDGKEKGMKSFSLHAEDLKAFINSCAHSMMSGDETKYHLCGIHLQCEKAQGNLTAVATDGHRLSLASRAFDDLPALVVTVPRKGVEELLKLDSYDMVGFHVGKNSMEVIQRGTFISIRLVEGDFPAYRKGIPSAYSDYCTVNRSNLIEAVNRVRLFSSRNSIVLEIGAVTISLRASKELDEGSDCVVCETKGCPLTIKMDARYFLDALSSFDCAEILLKYGDGFSPLVMLPADFGQWDERLAVLAAQRL